MSSPVILPGNVRRVDLKPLPVRLESGKYSRNLYNFLCRKTHYVNVLYTPRSFLSGNVVPLNPAAPDPSHILIGHQDGRWVHAARLNNIISGATTRTHAYTFGSKHFAIDISEDFWPRYREQGFCCLDPNHNFYCIGRHTTEGETRTCNWCGAKQKLTTTREVIVHANWENVA